MASSEPAEHAASGAPDRLGGGRLWRQLTTLLRASIELPRQASLEATLGACAEAARHLLQGQCAGVEWTWEGRKLSGRAGRGSSWGGELCSAPLPRQEGGGEGKLWVRGPSFDAFDRLSLSWLAQLSAVVLARAERLRISEQGTQRREELLGIVAHDLRGPLAVMRAAAEELSARSPETAPVADQLLRACRRMVRLVDDLLDSSQIDAGALRVTPGALSLARLLDEVKANLKTNGREVGFPQLDPDVFIWADRDRLLQVFSNLLGNALKFTPPEGKVWVEAEVTPDRAVIKVCDTGPGVPKEQRARLFDRYWSSAATQGNAGLGLYIARALVVAHGGQLELEDTERGASFRFDLPLAAMD
jgi:signal transduction histidine kinase